MSENEIRQRDYDNAYTDYTQSLHEENMRAAQKTSEDAAETNRAMAEATRATVEANREMVNINKYIVILTVVIASAAIAQVVSQWYWSSRSIGQTPIINVQPATVQLPAMQPTIIVSSPMAPALPAPTTSATAR